MVFNHLCVLFELKKLIRLEQKNHVYSIQTSIALGIIISACSMLSYSPKGLKIVNGMQIVYRLNRFLWLTSESRHNRETINMD